MVLTDRKPTGDYDWKLEILKVYLFWDIQCFVMYYIYVMPGLSLLIESTDSMIQYCACTMIVFSLSLSICTCRCWGEAKHTVWCNITSTTGPIKNEVNSMRMPSHSSVQLKMSFVRTDFETYAMVNLATAGGEIFACGASCMPCDQMQINNFTMSKFYQWRKCALFGDAGM